jgi:hypothetical protein
VPALGGAEMRAAIDYVHGTCANCGHHWSRRRDGLGKGNLCLACERESTMTKTHQTNEMRPELAEDRPKRKRRTRAEFDAASGSLPVEQFKAMRERLIERRKKLLLEIALINEALGGEAT